jgi:hypothetical protein
MLGNLQIFPLRLSDCHWNLTGDLERRVSWRRIWVELQLMSQLRAFTDNRLIHSNPIADIMMAKSSKVEINEQLKCGDTFCTNLVSMSSMPQSLYKCFGSEGNSKWAGSGKPWAEDCFLREKYLRYPWLLLTGELFSNFIPAQLESLSPGPKPLLAPDMNICLPEAIQER